jgi:hypothetical protein
MDCRDVYSDVPTDVGPTSAASSDDVAGLREAHEPSASSDGIGTTAGRGGGHENGEDGWTGSQSSRRRQRGGQGQRGADGREREGGTSDISSGPPPTGGYVSVLPGW